MTTPAPTPLLSVVMPTRNQAGFIGDAVRSVLSQAESLDSRLELVVADGASTDETPAILTALAQQHPDQIRWVSERDEGPADAVNRAVARATGSIIGWLNSDDLYTPGAAARALQAFRARPALAMVYGEGDHVDVHGTHLARYPTRGPDTPLAAWADGCHICQPTAFFRREAFQALGGLDTSLRTAFDYEFWLRMWKTYPGRIGFVQQVQAHSRLHDAGITLSMREKVALEGLEVIHRHIGPAPAHWLMTHVGEALRQCPFNAELAVMRAHLLELAERARPWLAPGGVDAVQRHMQLHRALQMARPDLMVDVDADGWAPPTLALRIRQPATPYRRLRVWGRHAAPGGGALRLTARRAGADGGAPLWQGGRTGAGPFDVLIPLPAGTADQALSLEIVSDTSFVPSQVQPGSQDHRRLAFMFDAAELL